MNLRSYYSVQHSRPLLCPSICLHLFLLRKTGVADVFIFKLLIYLFPYQSIFIFLNNSPWPGYFRNRLVYRFLLPELLLVNTKQWTILGWKVFYYNVSTDLQWLLGMSSNLMWYQIWYHNWWSLQVSRNVVKWVLSRVFSIF